MKKPKHKFEGWPTTRRYPRTLEEAFPKDPKHAEWFFPPQKERGKLELTMLSVGLWIWIGLAYWWVNT